MDFGSKHSKGDGPNDRPAHKAANTELLAALIDHGQEAVMIVGSDGIIRYATPNFKRLFNFDGAALAGQDLGLMLDSNDAAAVKAMIRQLNPGSGVSLRLRVRNGEQGWRWVQAGIEDRSAVPEIRGFLVQMRDVTQLMEFEAAVRETEESIRRSEAFYRMIIEGSSDLMILMDAQRRILFVNQVLVPLLGYKVSEVLGRDVFDFLQPQDQAEAAEALAVSMRKGWAGARIHARHQDGSLRFFEAHCRYTIDPDGRKIFVVAARDITRESALEQHAIQEGRLEAVGRLAGGIAHDFNNLLTVIQGNAEMALGQPEQPAEARLREIMDASVRAAELVQQLLTFGRKQQMQVKVLDLRDLLLEHEGFIRRVLGSGIRFKLAIPAEPCVVRAEPLSLTRALLNLAANAKDAMPQGGVFILTCAHYEVAAEEAEVHPGRRPGPFVRLDLRDTGTGMAREMLTRIFEPYFTTRGQGSGLGLPMVLGTVRQLGGFMQVESQPGQGSEFSLFLPLADAADLGKASAGEEGLSQPAARGQGRCILVVDDEPGVLRLAADGLRQAGFEVLEASDGEEALVLWREARHHHQSIHLVLSDVVMPRMNGVQLAEQLKSLDPEQRVLLMSGFYDAAQEAEAGSPVGLYKPFSVQVLCEAVQKCLI